MKTAPSIKLRNLKRCRRVLLLITVTFMVFACGTREVGKLAPKISLVNSPNDILTVGAHFLAQEIKKQSNDSITPKVYHSGVLSGGKGKAEIEMCQQGSIEIHITTTAYLANLAKHASVVSLPFLFKDIDQVVGLVKSNNLAFAKINQELNNKNLHIIAWWPRGFRQLTNSKKPVKSLEDLQGLTFRVMNNPLYVDNMNAMGANPVPMAWGEVYTGLQLNIIDGQENAEDVIYSSKLYEVQKFMTIWDYSTDIEVVLVNLDWWNGLEQRQRNQVQHAADASVDYQVELLRKNTLELRKKLAAQGMEIYHLPETAKPAFRASVKPVWEKYEKIFTKEYLDAFVAEVDQY